MLSLSLALHHGCTFRERTTLGMRRLVTRIPYCDKCLDDILFNRKRNWSLCVFDVGGQMRSHAAEGRDQLGQSGGSQVRVAYTLPAADKSVVQQPP